MLEIGEVAWVAVDSADQVLSSADGYLIEDAKDQLESELHVWGFKKEDYEIKKVRITLAQLR